jgi:hypothetical protein
MDDFQKKIFSFCSKEILSGQYYVRDLISNQLINSNWDDGQAQIKRNTLAYII